MSNMTGLADLEAFSPTKLRNEGAVVIDIDHRGQTVQQQYDDFSTTTVAEDGKVDDSADNHGLENRPNSPHVSFAGTQGSTGPSLRTAARKIMAMHRLSSNGPNNIYGWGKAGDEPGINVNTMNVDLSAKCEITVAEYSKTHRRIIQSLDNDTFLKFLEKNERPKWSKVRWINVNGLSWDIIKALALKYDLHRLALEDLIHVPQRTKADHYSNHTFISLNLHYLLHTIGAAHPGHVEGDDRFLDDGKSDLSYHKKWSWVKRIFRLIKLSSKDRDSREDELRFAANTAAGIPPNQSRMTLNRYHNPHGSSSRFLENHHSLRKHNLTVAIEQVGIFTTNDGVVISFFSHSAKQIEKPIIARLGSEDTLLRSTEDPSLLLQAIIDSMIDSAIPIVAAYQEEVATLEMDVLTAPEVGHVRDLHIMLGELSLLKRTIYPIVALLNSLRDHRRMKEKNEPEMLRGSQISAMAALYMADVADHVEELTSDLDILRSTVENMIDMIFNTVASTQNESMKQLSLVTVVFLPLTFITGYFGMNFNDFPAVGASLSDQPPDANVAYFWKVSTPVTAFVVLLVCWGWISRWLETMGRKIEQKAIQRRKNNMRKARKEKLIEEKREFKRRNSRIVEVKTNPMQALDDHYA